MILPFPCIFWFQSTFGYKKLRQSGRYHSAAITRALSWPLLEHTSWWSRVISKYILIYILVIFVGIINGLLNTSGLILPHVVHRRNYWSWHWFPVMWSVLVMPLISCDVIYILGNVTSFLWCDLCRSCHFPLMWSTSVMPLISCI